MSWTDLPENKDVLSSPSFLSAPVHHVQSQTADQVYDMLHSQYTQYVLKWKQVFLTGVEFSSEQEDEMHKVFDDPQFLYFLDTYISREVRDIYSDWNADAFSRISELWFFLAKWDISKIGILWDVHNLNISKVERMCHSYESYIAKYEREGNQELLEWYLNLYLSLIDVFTLISVFNEMDHERKKNIYQLVSTLRKSIETIKNIPNIWDIKLTHDAHDEKKISFFDSLIYRDGRFWVNFTHTKKIDLQTDIYRVTESFQEILDEIYQNYQKVAWVNFLHKPQGKNTLTGAFISNTTSLVLYFVDYVQNSFKGDKASVEMMQEFFDHPCFYENILLEYQSQMSRVLSHDDQHELLNYPAPKNFDDVSQYGLDMTARNYDRVISPEKLPNRDIVSMVEDIKKSLTTQEQWSKQIDFRMDFLFQELFYTSEKLDKNLLEWLLAALIQSDRFCNYHTQAVKIKLIDITLKKLFWYDTFSQSSFELLQQVRIYIEKNKKNSILLNVYGRLYLTLAYCYSKHEEYDKKAMNLYFVYKQLSITEDIDEIDGMTSEYVFKNIFPNLDLSKIRDSREYTRYYTQFIEEQRHIIRKSINELQAKNKPEAFHKSLECISEWFFHGMVYIYVCMDEVDREPFLQKWYQREEFDMDILGTSHTVFLDYPNNYKVNFLHIYNEERIQHLKAEILTIYKNLQLYTTPTDKKIQNMLVEVLDEKIWGVIAYKQPIRDETQKIVAYESLCRFEDQMRNEIVMYDENWKRLYIDYILKGASHLWYTPRITKEMLEKVFSESSENRECEFNINLSYEDIMNNDILDIIFDLKMRYPENYSNVVIELLENEICNEKWYVKQLEKLSQQGFKLVIDDFWAKFNNYSVIDLLFQNNISIYKIKLDSVITTKIMEESYIDSLDIDISLKVKMKRNSAMAISFVKFAIEQAGYVSTWGIVAEFVNEKNVKILRNLWVKYFQWNIYWAAQRELVKEKNEIFDI